MLKHATLHENETIDLPRGTSVSNDDSLQDAIRALTDEVRSLRRELASARATGLPNA